MLGGTCVTELVADGLCDCRVFNTGSPWNVPAGQGGANLDALIAHYKKKNAEHDEKVLKKLRENELSEGKK